MAEFGRRNKGKPKKLTPAGIAQRRKAGKASARLRKLNALASKRRKATDGRITKRLSGLAPYSPTDLDGHTPANIAPLAQTKAEK